MALNALTLHGLERVNRTDRRHATKEINTDLCCVICEVCDSKHMSWSLDVVVVA